MDDANSGYQVSLQDHVHLTADSNILLQRTQGSKQILQTSLN